MTDDRVLLERANARIVELEELIFQLDKKGPHLHGCAKCVDGSWVCDVRCLVGVVEQMFVLLSAAGDGTLVTVDHLGFIRKLLENLLAPRLEPR
jgi:hypothetical protein